MLPCSSLYRSDHQVITANDFRIESGKDSHQDILDLVLVGDEQITVGAVTAGFIQRYWLRRAHMNEQWELALPGFICALRAT